MDLKTRLGIALLLIGLPAQGWSRPAENGKKAEATFGKPPFVFRVLQLPADSGRTALEIELGLINDVLQFVRIDSGTYAAGYEVAVDVVDEDKNRIAGSLFRRRLMVNTFDESNSREHLNQECVTLQVPPGTYRLMLDIMDLETRKHLRREREIEVRDYRADRLQMGEFGFFEQPSGHPDSLLRNLSREFTDRRARPVVRVPVGGLVPGDSAVLRFRLSDWKNRRIAEWQKAFLPQTRATVFNEILPDSVLKNGRYKITVICRQGKRQQHGKDFFAIQYARAPGKAAPSVIDINDRIGPMKYILPEDPYRKLIAADSAEQRIFWEQFWKRRDPTPGTPENELQQEFYRRVAFANCHFTLIADQRRGWQTDRGRIYIRYGAPDWVRRPGQELDHFQTEVWYYRNLDRRFVFRDKHGNGDFKLIYKE